MRFSRRLWKVQNSYWADVSSAGEYACAVNPAGVIFAQLALCEQSIAIAAAEVVDAILEDFFSIVSVCGGGDALRPTKIQREANAP